MNATKYIVALSSLVLSISAAGAGADDYPYSGIFTTHACFRSAHLAPSTTEDVGCYEQFIIMSANGEVTQHTINYDLFNKSGDIEFYSWGTAKCRFNNSNSVEECSGPYGVVDDVLFDVSFDKFVATDPKETRHLFGLSREEATKTVSSDPKVPYLRCGYDLKKIGAFLTDQAPPAGYAPNPCQMSDKAYTSIANRLTK
jgi:hypothetical protein